MQLVRDVDKVQSDHIVARFPQAVQLPNHLIHWLHDYSLGIKWAGGFKPVGDERSGFLGHTRAPL